MGRSSNGWAEAVTDGCGWQVVVGGHRQSWMGIDGHRWVQVAQVVVGWMASGLQVVAGGCRW